MTSYEPNDPKISGEPATTVGTDESVHNGENDTQTVATEPTSLLQRRSSQQPSGGPAGGSATNAGLSAIAAPQETEVTEVAPSSPSRLSLVTPKSIAEQEVLSAQIDRLSLEQALLDVEVANARVLDLTARLVEAQQRIATLNLDVDSLHSTSEKVKVEAEVEVTAIRSEMIEKQAYLDAQRSSSAFKWASKVWNIRNALRGS